MRREHLDIETIYSANLKTLQVLGKVIRKLRYKKDSVLSERFFCDCSRSNPSSISGEGPQEFREEVTCLEEDATSVHSSGLLRRLIDLEAEAADENLNHDCV